MDVKRLSVRLLLPRTLNDAQCREDACQSCQSEDSNMVTMRCGLINPPTIYLAQNLLENKRRGFEPSTSARLRLVSGEKGSFLWPGNVNLISANNTSGATATRTTKSRGLSKYSKMERRVRPMYLIGRCTEGFCTPIGGHKGRPLPRHTAMGTARTNL